VALIAVAAIELLVIVLVATPRSSDEQRSGAWIDTRSAYGDPAAWVSIQLVPARVGTNQIRIDLQHPELAPATPLYGRAVAADDYHASTSELGAGLYGGALGSIEIDRAGTWRVTADIYGTKATGGIYGLNDVVFDVPISAELDSSVDPIDAMRMVGAGIAIMSVVALLIRGRRSPRPR
jgi:hypothetical protein